MNSREALEHIIFDAKMEKPIFSRYYQEFLKPIEKDLEVLDILKKNIFVADNMIYATSNKLNDDDYKKLKEWINDSN